MEVSDWRFQMAGDRSQESDRKGTTDEGQRTKDEGRDLKDCFFSERSHGFIENKGDAKKRTQNEAIRSAVFCVSCCKQIQ